MSGVGLRNMGTTAAFAPVIKRGIATLSDGRVATLVIDANLAAATGATDVTGVAKICVYLSTDASRTAHSLAINYTPAVAPCSSTRYAVASMSVGSGDKLYVVWQGTDNGLYMSSWTYSAGVFTFSATQTVVASGAVTNRFRVVDVDITGTGRPVVAAYEANDSAGLTAFARVYVLKTDDTTWVRASSISTLTTGQYIKPKSEDISVAWRGDGIVSNVGRYLLYCTQTYTAGDKGDVVREYSVNVSTATTDSATVSGTWYTNLNAKNASGSRRAIIFTLNSTLWLLAGVYGTATPRFFATKLATGSYGAPTFTYAGFVSSVALSSYFKIDVSANGINAWSATYKDNRLSFGFISPGSTSAFIVREIVFSFASVSAVTALAAVDQVPRPLDGGRFIADGPIAIFGGDNRRVASSLKTYNYSVMYGRYGNTATNLPRFFWFVAEDTFTAPVNVSPVDTSWVGGGTATAEPTNRPTYRVRVDNPNLTPNLYGKIEIQVASNSSFTTNVKSIVQPDSALQYFGSKDGFSGAGKIVSVETTDAAAYLFSGTWYFRSRIVSDKDTPGAWSDYSKFVVSHPPTANPTSPAKGSIISYDGANAANLVVNPSFSVDNTSWVNTGVTSSTVSATQFNSSPQSNRVVPTGAAADTMMRQDLIPVVAGQSYKLGVWVRADTTNKSVKISILWKDNLGATLGTSTSTTAVGAANTWTEYTLTASNSAYPTVHHVEIQAGLTGTPAAGDAFYLDDFSFIQVSGIVNFVWQFNDTDPGNAQTEYNLNLYRTDTGAALLSTGWVVSGAQSLQYVLDAAYFEIPLAWTIQLKDSDSVAGPVTALQDFTFGYNPVVTITAPLLSSTIETASPSITWTFVGSGNRTQRAYRIYVYSFESDSIIADTLWRIGAETTYTFPTNILLDLHTYEIHVQVQDTGGLYGEMFIEIDTDWAEPTPGDLTLTNDNFKVTLSWTNANKDVDFVSWRVYRRYMVPASASLDLDNTATNWVLLYETADDLASYTYLDYQVPLNKNVDYIVVQVADRFGSIIESNLLSFYVKSVTVAADKYYFVPSEPVGTIASYESNSVVGDQFTRDIEQETLHVIGRGRQVQIGDDLGYSGSLTLKLRNPSAARVNREFLEMLSATNNSTYIKTPFGDVVLVSIGSIQTSRVAGYSGADIVDLTVPYVEVIAPDQIIREG